MAVKVVHVTSASRMVYGAVHSMLTLANAQRDAGYDVQFVTFQGKEFGQELRDLGWPVHEFRFRFKIDPFTAPVLAKFFRREKFDIVHTHLSTSSINGCFAAKLATIPSVATVHGMSGKLSFMFADHMIGVSEGVRRHLIDQGIKPDRVTAVYNGVQVPADVPSKAEARAEFDIPNDAIVYGTVARLTALKGVEHSIRAFAEIRKQQPRAWYALVGDGDEASNYRELAKFLGIGDKVLFLGYQEKVFDALAAMDLFLFPSLKEAMGISVVEALAMGLPVVSTNVGGLPEVVTPDVGALVPAQDPQAMATEALRIVGEGIAAYGQRAKERAESHFSIASMLRGTEQVYNRLRGLQ